MAKPVIPRLAPPLTSYHVFNAVYMQPSTFGPHTHEDHEINVAQSGMAYYELEDGSRVEMRQGDILLLPGGVPQKLFVPEQVIFHCHEIGMDLAKETASASGRMAELARLCSTEKPLPPRVTRMPGVAGILGDVYRQFLAENAEKDAWFTMAVRRLGELAAIQFIRLMERPAVPWTSDAESRVQTVRAWIDRHFAEEVTLADLADMAHLSNSHFSSLFRRQTEMAPMAFLYRRRLDAAAVLLARTNRPVTSIAWSVGFDSIEHFSRAFRKFAGVCPQDFRKKHQV